MRRLPVILGTLVLGASAAAAPNPPSPAVSFAAPLTLPEMPLHDPWIVADKITRTYWLFTTNQPRMTGEPRPGIMAYASHDLMHWARPRPVFVLPKGMWANAGAWAPEVHRWKGRWYLFSTFHNQDMPIPAAKGRQGIRRGTVLAVSDRLDGSYRLVHDGAPIVDKGRMTLDGTLYVDPRGKPWLVYAHEWVQIGDGAMEAIPLDDRLASAGAPRLLFHSSAAPWLMAADKTKGNLVTDGPELYRTHAGTLLMLWSSYEKGSYVETLARSTTGEIGGSWEQLGPLVKQDSGHGMLFRRFDGQLMMVLHRPFEHARGKLYFMRDNGDRVSVIREATELDGETKSASEHSSKPA